MKSSKSFFLLVFAFAVLPRISLLAQDTLVGRPIDIGTVRLTRNLVPYVSSGYIEKREQLPLVFTRNGLFSPRIRHTRTVPNNYVDKKAVIRFSLSNNSDTVAGIYFYPGLYYKSILLYRRAGDRLEAIPPRLPDNIDSIGYRFIPVEPHDTSEIYAELTFIKTYINIIRPRLVSKEYVNSFVMVQHVSNDASELITYIFCGLLLMMILFSIANFLQGANREFLYYSGYAFFVGGMLFTKALFIYHADRLNYFFEEYFDFVMQSLGHLFYMAFMSKYLGTRRNHPFLFRLYNSGIAVLIVSVIAYTIIHYFSDNFPLENLVENSTKVFLLALTLVFLIYGLRHWQDKMIRYLFWGNFFLFVFALLSQGIILFGNIPKGMPGILRDSLFYYELGLFLELVFFLMALNHKNRRQLITQARERERLRAENQMKEYEKELAVFKAQQSERERISADIHDELGSGMTAIRLMSELAKSKMKENIPAEIDKISLSADEVLNKMNAIIWSMNSGNDTLDNLVSYIRSYALEYFENTSIHCIVHTPETIPPTELTGDKRRNLFLCVKETLNNALKHSKATELHISFTIGSELVIIINDNGVGIDMNRIRQFANGLKNIARRMESIGGRFEIESNHGTVTRLSLPL